MDDLEKVSQITRFERSQHGERIIDSSTSAARFAKIKTAISESMELLDKVLTTGANEAILKKHVMHAKLRIVKSHLKLSFMEKYADELDSDDADNLMKQVSNIIGDIDEDSEKHAWKSKVTDMSRRVEQSEKFTAYYDRITNVLSKADCDEKTKTWLTDDKFESSLSPGEKEFIIVHGVTGNDAKANAALLDDKKQHVYKVAVKAVMEDDRINRLEQSQAEMLTQMKAIAEKVCKPPPAMHEDNKNDDMMKQLLMQNAAIINCMQVQQGELGSYRGGNNSNRGRGGSYRGNSFRGGRGGRPYRSGAQCYHCGRYGHDEKECRIKDSTTFTCMKCGQTGHSQFSPKFHPSVSKN